jgi:hypothetical protein
LVEHVTRPGPGTGTTRAEVLRMEPRFSELFLVDAPRTFNFFATSLGEVIGQDVRHTAGAAAAEPVVSRDEFLYVSSILAHYAFVEAGNAEYLPIPGTLRQLHDLFVTDVGTWSDPELMETAAAHALMLTGYFAGAMRVRHDLGTYVRWGRFFFDRAASGASGKKGALLHGMHRHFPAWRDRLERLHQDLWERQVLLDVPARSDARLAG